MKKVAAIIITVLMLANGSTLRAEIITIAIEATVDWVDDPCNVFEGNITPGDIVTGTYKYDSETSDSNPLSTVGHYWHYDSPFGVSLSVGGFDFRNDPCNVNFVIGITNDHGPLERDGYVLQSYYNLPLSNGVPVGHISWQLDDDSGQALSSIELPITAPILSDWDQPFGLSFETQRQFFVRSYVTSAVVIPEPVSIIAFGYAFMVLRKHGPGKHRQTVSLDLYEGGNKL